MIWKEQLNKFEQTNDWRAAIQLLEQVIKTNSNELEVYIRTIFLLLDFLVEGKYTPEEHNYAAGKLKLYFDESYKKFSDNAEYLFFLGYFIVIAEWYFGIDNVVTAYQMRRKAMEKEPNNILYEWAYKFSDSENKEAGYLAGQLLNYEKEKIHWLRSKGKAGEYIFGMIECCYKNYTNSVRSKL